MNRTPKNFSLRSAAAGIAVIALMSVAACTTEESTSADTPTVVASDTSAAGTTSAPATSAPATSAAPETTSAPASSAPATEYTDASLAAVLTKVTVDGKAASPLPIATVRSQAGTEIKVEPAACSFAGQGLLPYVKENPAALAVPAATAGMSLVSLSAADADKLIADRDALLSNPDCANVTLTTGGQKITSKIAAQETEGFGFEEAKIMVSNGGTGDVYGFTGRKGNLVASVNSPDLAQIKAVATQIAANL
ncbi:hypothetical protein IPV09_02205 [Tessaracoccus sp. SD287]|uniref:hypothetical protein n=1 Tax=Tessaracoccus sp. SD287 TaxID=2782008 RepID=UPI001A97066B|nr:hypothetical protein [Tessaracoccus sp. SD287]MBO1030145.1 hypothetical protein [Tessaracoccus sp. SD287]